MTTPYDASPYLQESPYLNESAYLQGEAPEGLSPLVRLILMRRYGVYVSPTCTTPPTVRTTRALMSGTRPAYSTPTWGECPP